MYFVNRSEAGKKLAIALSHYKYYPVVVYGIVCGGVTVAVEVARYLNAPLDILIPRAIPDPFHPACPSSTYSPAIKEVHACDAAADPNFADADYLRETAEACHCRHMCLAGREQIPIEGRTAILLSDGIATGHTMKQAIKEVRKRGPNRIVVAVPVIPHDAHQWLVKEVDEIVALESPAEFATAVAEYNEDFRAVEEDELSQAIREYAIR